MHDGVCDDAAVFVAYSPCSSAAKAVPAGPTCIVQCKRAVEEEDKDKAIKKRNKKVDELTATDQKLKEVTILGMKGAAIKQCVVTMATDVGMIEKQIDLLERTKHVLVACWGQEEYDNRVAELMTKMLDDRKMGGKELKNDGNVGDGGDDDVDE